MGHLSRRLAAAALLAVAAFFVTAFVSSSARAEFITLNFLDVIDSSNPGPNPGIGEQAINQYVGDLSVIGYRTDNPSITTAPYKVRLEGANWMTIDGSYDTAPYAYLDGGGAGVGVCQTLNGNGMTKATRQCSPNSDDNVTGDPSENDNSNSYIEVLSLAFPDEEVGISELFFRNEGHTAAFTSGSVDIAKGSAIIDDVDITDFVNYELVTNATGLGATLVGDPKWELAKDEFLYIKYHDQQFYLSGLELWPVPVPAALPLFVSGLAGLGFAGWRRKRAKQSV